MKKFSILFFVAFALLACRSQKGLTSQNIFELTDSISIVQTITPVQLPADSANIRAVLECDSNYNVVLKELINLKSKNIEASFNWSGGVLDYQVRTGGYTVYSFNHYYFRFKKVKETHYITRTIKVDKLALKYKALIFVLAGLVIGLLYFNFRNILKKLIQKFLLLKK